MQKLTFSSNEPKLPTENCFEKPNLSRKWLKEALNSLESGVSTQIFEIFKSCRLQLSASEARRLRSMHACKTKYVFPFQRG